MSRESPLTQHRYLSERELLLLIGSTTGATDLAMTRNLTLVVTGVLPVANSPILRLPLVVATTSGTLLSKEAELAQNTLGVEVCTGIVLHDA